MGISEYIDGILMLLKTAGVPEAEIDEKRTELVIEHAFLKGVAFEIAARAVLQKHDVEVVE